MRAQLFARHRDQYRVLVLKVVIERTDADAGEFGYSVGVEGHWPVSLQNSSSGFENNTHRLSRALLGRRFSHVFKILLHLLHSRIAVSGIRVGEQRQRGYLASGNIGQDEIGKA